MVSSGLSPLGYPHLGFQARTSAGRNGQDALKNGENTAPATGELLSFSLCLPSSNYLYRGKKKRSSKNPKGGWDSGREFLGGREDPRLTRGALGAGEPQPHTHPLVSVSLQLLGSVQRVRRHRGDRLRGPTAGTDHRDRPRGSAEAPPGRNRHFPLPPVLAGQLDGALDIRGVSGHVMEISVVVVGAIPSW